MYVRTYADFHIANWLKFINLRTCPALLCLPAGCLYLPISCSVSFLSCPFARQPLKPWAYIFSPTHIYNDATVPNPSNQCPLYISQDWSCRSCLSSPRNTRVKRSIFNVIPFTRSLLTPHSSHQFHHHPFPGLDYQTRIAPFIYRAARAMSTWDDDTKISTPSREPPNCLSERNRKARNYSQPALDHGPASFPILLK